MNRATIIARAGFVLLGLASVVALFGAQRLKQSDALVSKVFFTSPVSPNGDGYRDRVKIGFRLDRSDDVSVAVVRDDGTTVKTVIKRRSLNRGHHRVSWNGRTDGGSKATDGSYRLRFALARSGRAFTTPQVVTVDTERPNPVVTKITPPVITPGVRGRSSARITYRGGAPRQRAQFYVYGVGANGRAGSKPVASFFGAIKSNVASWDGTVGRFRYRRARGCVGRYVSYGRPRPAPAGTYVIVLAVCDAAGNRGTGPSNLPPRRRPAVRGRPGVTVRYLEAAPPLRPARPGGRLTVAVATTTGAYRYRLRALATGRTLRSGRDDDSILDVRIPRRADAGLYILTLTSRSSRRHTAKAPVVIANKPRKARDNAGRPLVVMPSVSWQGTNQVDTDRDGFGETLASIGESRQIRFDRPLRAGRLPARMFDREAALVEFLEASAIPFDITTDAALASSFSQLTAGRRLLIFPGDERWLTPGLGLALRAFVEHGGNLVNFGADPFRRTVRVGRGRDGGLALTRPSPRSDRDVFGEAVRIRRIAPAPVVAFVDPAGLLPVPVGLFSEYEESVAVADGADVGLRAGREAGHPAVIGYRIGDGLVVRVGARGWLRQLRAEGARGPLGQVTRRIINQASVAGE